MHPYAEKYNTRGTENVAGFGYSGHLGMIKLTVIADPGHFPQSIQHPFDLRF